MMLSKNYYLTHLTDFVYKIEYRWVDSLNIE